MGDTIRFIIEYQYVDAQRTATESFRFLDNWFNNGDGQHVPVPHPVNYYIWGAGGAAYYGRGNTSGERADLIIPDGSFEETPIPDGAITAPAGTKWRFSGGAGMVRNLTSAVESYTPDRKTTAAANSAFGWRFTVGEKPIYVYQLGRMYFCNSDRCRLLLLQAENHAVLLDQQIDKLFRFPNFQRPRIMENGCGQRKRKGNRHGPRQLSLFDAPRRASASATEAVCSLAAEPRPASGHHSRCRGDVGGLHAPEGGRLCRVLRGVCPNSFFLRAGGRQARQSALPR